LNRAEAALKIAEAAEADREKIEELKKEDARKAALIKPNDKGFDCKKINQLAGVKFVSYVRPACNYGLCCARSTKKDPSDPSGARDYHIETCQPELAKK